jgi:hypothetical protein
MCTPLGGHISGPSLASLLSSNFCCLICAAIGGWSVSFVAGPPALLIKSSAPCCNGGSPHGRPAPRVPFLCLEPLATQRVVGPRAYNSAQHYRGFLSNAYTFPGYCRCYSFVCLAGGSRLRPAYAPTGSTPSLHKSVYGRFLRQ